MREKTKEAFENNKKQRKWNRDSFWNRLLKTNIDICFKRAVILFKKTTMQENKKYLNKLRHSTAHLLAAGVLELYPDAKLAIGPATDDGFYYDIDFGKTKVSKKDLGKIEKKMQKIAKNWKKFKKHEVSKKDALKEFAGNEYKKELIKEFAKGGQELTVYQSGSFRDLCKGGHVDSPNNELGHFKLTKVAGAYWRGDEKNKMLTRIYGTAFPSKKELEGYLAMLKEAKKRDHRKIGKKLDLFTFSQYVGPGLPLYTRKGALVRRILNEFIEKEQKKLGYEQVWTPQIGKAELFKKSGHYAKYKDDMFKVVSNYSNEEFYLKPMNCPQHTQIYASKPRSYRDLPIRMSDFAMLYRDEKPGELSGLGRVRAFSQDDSHIFCREDQVDEEVDKALGMIKKIMKIFNLKYRYRLSTRDLNEKDKYLGDPKTWDKVEKWAIEIMKRNDIDYFDGPGEAAFYAPKMDLMATDALGREWQLSTVQIDYVQPQRFGLTYIDSDGEEKTPIMIHRAILGSVERFMMIMIEHFAGAFPVWLSPVQVKILPITDRNTSYSKKVSKHLSKVGVRVEIDSKSETLGNKIRNAQTEKIPYMLIIGDKEEKENKVSVRLRSEEDLGKMKIDEFEQRIQEKIAKKSLDL